VANLPDYLDWRGDLPFTVSPFNEVDCYLLAKVGCADFTGIVPADGGVISIGEAVERYFARYGSAGDYFGALASASIGPALRRLPQTERFRAVGLTGFEKKTDPAASEQFSALTLVLPDGTHFITFRGTDDTLAGWRENFMMSLVDPVAAQADAGRYLAWAACTYPGTLIVGGHSKGGNLAVYAAATASESVQDRIGAVYNLDGPGFAAAFLAAAGYRRIRPRLHTVLPQHSLIGLLLTHETTLTIVRSSRSGPAAHDGFNWEVLGTQFVRCGELSRGSRAFDESINTLLAQMDLAQRREFIDQVFELLGSSGAKTITDITAHKLQSLLELSRGIRREKGVQSFAWDVLEGMAHQYFLAERTEAKARFRTLRR